MNAKQQEQVIRWLNTAYTMEKSVAQVLSRQLDDFPKSPQIVDQLKEHIKDSNSQAEKLRGRIMELGGSVGGVTGVQTRMASVIGNIQDTLTGSGEAKGVRDTIANFATENLEVGTYQALAVAATEVGDVETAKLAQSILSDEQKSVEMAAKNIPEVVKSYVSRLA